ncbi:MAG: isoprenylcysteine carboxylmethyltransferase family protein [candidate division NC10 bacterium]|nr:isoprenylcysteine carboxylmethyltransferase family protein [candidate division NC10 bacterium]
MSVDERLPSRRWALLSAVLLTFTILVLLPLLVTKWDSHLTPVSLGPLRWLGLIPICLGPWLGIWSATVLVTRGEGTPAPWRPPERLVLAGPYQAVRHPMLVGAFAVLLGEALLAESVAILLYLGVVVGVAHWYVAAVEEPALQVRFGDAYRVYQQCVPRWLPRRRRAPRSE